MQIDGWDCTRRSGSSAPRAKTWVGRYDENSEDSVLFDVQSHPEYENIKPETVLADDFALGA